MKVEFYFDPSCPFSWITSRWLQSILPHRSVEIDWLPFSLALKNKELASGNSPHRDIHLGSHRLLRVMAAAWQHYQTPYGEFYTLSGTRHHLGDEPFNDDLIIAALRHLDLPEELLDAAKDQGYDDQLQQHVNDAINIGGSDIGVPFIVFTGDNGAKQGFFGPVLQQLPPLEESLELWDGLSKLATNSSFYELKRTRPNAAPDVASTA